MLIGMIVCAIGSIGGGWSMIFICDDNKLIVERVYTNHSINYTYHNITGDEHVYVEQFRYE